MPEFSFKDSDPYRGEDVNRYLKELAPAFDLHAAILGPGDAQRGPALTRGFDFFVANAGRRYTDRTLMSVRRAASSLNAGSFEEDEFSFGPWVLTVEAPLSYDPDTEVKTGGLVAMLLGLPGEERLKGVFSVASSLQGQGLGRTILTVARNWLPSMTFYVHRSNIPGLVLGLKLGYTPASVSSSGTVELT